MSEKKNIVIVSAGKFGREVFGWLEQTIAAGHPWRIKGFLDHRPNVLDGFAYDAPILGPAETYQPEPDDGFVCAIGDPVMKKKLGDALVARGADFINLVHPTAIVGRNVRLGKGVILGPLTSLTSDLVIGNFVSIGPFSGCAHDTSIGDYCQLSSHCGVNGNAALEEGVFLGSHACVIPYARVGAWAYVGAGSVVLRRVKPGTKVFGNPAVAIGAVEQ